MLPLLRIWSRLGPAMILAAGSSLAACSTSITHEKISETTVQEDPGFSYFLPKQSYTAAVVYELQKCPGDPNVAKDDDLEITHSATVVERSEPDLSQQYLLTYASLTSAFKTSTFTAATHPNRTLKSVGATIDDRTSAIIKNLTATGISVARMALGLPASALDKPKRCNDRTYAALASVRQAEKILIDPTVESKAKAHAAEALTHAKNQLRLTATLQLTPEWQTNAQPAKITSAKETLSPAQLEKWFVKGFRATYVISDPDTTAEFDALTTTEVAVKTSMSPAPAHTIAEPGEGVIYRDPLPAMVMVCVPDCNAAMAVPATLATQIAQLGRTMVVTLDNGVFDKNNVTLNFALNGSLESLTFGQESTLEKASAALAGSAEQLHGLLESRRIQRDAEEAAAESAELKALQAETALLNAKAARIEAENKLRALGGDPNN